MMGKRGKKSQRKVIHLLYRKKNVPPLSQLLTITSQAKKIKNLVQNNRALAFAAHEARSEVATYKNMLQDYFRDRNQILFAQLKIKDMAETIKKLVSDLEDVSACLNLSSKDILPTQTDYIKNRSKVTSLSTIKEADSSLSEEESFSPLEEGKDCTPFEGIQENSYNVEDRILNTDSASCPVYSESVKQNASEELIVNKEEGISPSLEKQSNTVDVSMSQPSLVASRKSKRCSEGCAPEGEKSAFANIENSNGFNKAELLKDYPRKLKSDDSYLFKKPIFFETNLKTSKIPIFMQSKEDKNKLTENFKIPREKEDRRETFVISSCKANAPESSISSNQRRGTFVIAHPETSNSSILDRRGTYVLSSPEHNIVDRRGTYVLSTFDEQSAKAVDKPAESNLSHKKTCESTVLNNTILLPEDMELTEVITFTNTFPSKNNVDGLETSISPPSVTLDTNKDILLRDEIQPIGASERSADKFVSQENNSFETSLICKNGSAPTENEDLEKGIFSDHSTKAKQSRKSAKQSRKSKKSATKKSIPVKYLEDCNSSEVLEKPASEILEKETTFLSGICALDPIAVIQAESATKPRLSQQRKVRKSVALYKKESISKLLEGKDDLNSEVQIVGKDAALQNSQCSETKKPNVSKSGSLRDKKSLVESSKEERDYSHHGLQHKRENVLEKFISEEERTCMPETLDEGISPVIPLGPRVSKRCKSAQKYSLYFTSDSESNSTSDEEFILKPRKVKDKRIECILPKEAIESENKTSKTSRIEKSLSKSAKKSEVANNQETVSVPQINDTKETKEKEVIESENKTSETSHIEKSLSKSAQKCSEFSSDLETSITSNEELNKEPENPVKGKAWCIQPRRVLTGKNKRQFIFRKRTSPMPSNDETKNKKLVLDEKDVFRFSGSFETRSSSDGTHNMVETHRNCHSEVANNQKTVPVPQINDTKETKEKEVIESENKTSETSHIEKSLSKSAQKYSEFSSNLETSITSNEELNKEPENPVKGKAWYIQPSRVLTGENKHQYINRKRKSLMPSNDETKNKKLVLDEKDVFCFSGSSETRSSSSDGTHNMVETHRNCHSEVANNQETVSVPQINDTKETKEKLLSNEQRKSRMTISWKNPAKISIRSSSEVFVFTASAENEEEDFVLNDEEKNRKDNKTENDSDKINHDVQEEEVIENPAGKFSAFDNDDVQSQKNKTKTSSGRKSILTTKTKNTNHRKVSISTKRVSICENITYFDQKVDTSKPLSEAKPVKVASKLISELQSRESTDVADIETGATKSNSSNKLDLFQDSLDSNERLIKAATRKTPKRSGKVKLGKSAAKDFVDLGVLTTTINCISDKQVKVDETKEENNSAFQKKKPLFKDNIANLLKDLSEKPVSAEPVLIGTSFAKISKSTAKSKTKKSNNKQKNALFHDENVCTLNVVNPELKPTLSKDAKSDAETYEKENKFLPLNKKSSSKQAVDLCKDLEKNSITAVKDKESRSLPAYIANDLDLVDKPSNSTDDMSQRSRRAKPISYKEPRLNVKLRRNF
ncbi:inner centromere protein A-like [Stegodyphus dumicola]|uniref:inner centromere protein A-like n=1 Tax=Stegodyphus dumicola TaxID=202533 RepID=UPI0015ACEB31|nr:inner centromere protein A-like [Stegodyphus dumicola]XP_035224656.1 inner centromere protein A-like [Stegodyphus dumicola]